MTPDDIGRLMRLVRSLDSVFNVNEGKPQPDGVPSPVFEQLTELLGDGWWRSFPVGKIEQLASLLEMSGAGLGGPTIARQLRGLADRIQLERMGAKGVDEPLDENIWRKVTDDVAKAEAEHARTSGPQAGGGLVTDTSSVVGAEDTWKAGYSAGYAQGFRERVPEVKDATGKVIEVGDIAQKTKGDYEYLGVVVAIFTKESSEAVRVVVESKTQGASGMLHIFSPAQLTVRVKKSNRRRS